MTQIAAIIGGGVIGGGWAARFLLNGWHVRVFDPDPQAERKIAEVLYNAGRSLPGLYEAPLPAEGLLSFHDEISLAVQGATWIQESVPEQLDLKKKNMRLDLAGAVDSQRDEKVEKKMKISTMGEEAVQEHPVKTMTRLGKRGW